MARFSEIRRSRQLERIEFDFDPDQRITTRMSNQNGDIPKFETGFDVDPDERIVDHNIPRFAI